MPNHNLYQQARDVLYIFQNSLLEQDLERWIDLFDEAIVFEFPYAPENFPQKLEGKAEIRNHIEELPNLLQFIGSPPRICMLINLIQPLLPSIVVKVLLLKQGNHISKHIFL